MADVDSKIALSIAATFFEYSNRCRRADVAQCAQHTAEGVAERQPHQNRAERIVYHQQHQQIESSHIVLKSLLSMSSVCCIYIKCNCFVNWHLC